MKNARTYNPQDPIECLELHLKKIVVNDYRGMRPDVDFAKFFVLESCRAATTSGLLINVDDFNWTTKLHQELDLHLKAVHAILSPNLGRKIPLSGLTSNISLDLPEFWIDQKGDQLAYNIFVMP